MPGTRSRGAGKTTAGVAADGSGGNFPAGQPGDESAERELTSQQENMENSTLKDLMDAEILRLRASDTASRKKLDDICGEVADQVKVVTAAKTKPKDILVQYTKVLEDLFDKGDKLLATFTENNGTLLEKLEMLLLRLEGVPDEHQRVEAVRNTIVGQAQPYTGMFRKLRVQHENLLLILLESTEAQRVTASIAAPDMLHSRKEYSFLNKL